ncbi:MAG: transcription elongation factor GreA [Oscillospiraceae bacterium]|jgi:transcription elongation factor GreA|nr:transcription elongation factor GreA [Oscillospiraceae bacterium]
MAREQKTLTVEGFRKLEERLEYLKTTKRSEIADNIRVARSYGDLSENSEYDEAKNEQGIVEQEIMELEETLKNAKVVDESNLNMDYISVGLAVRLLNMEENREVEYRIVGSSESNPSKGMISDESPIGKHLIGKRLNDLVEIVIPKGTYHFKIIGISK